jgi:PAS domain S-box-containing protein
MPDDSFFKSLIDNAEDIIVRFDRSMRHVYVNRAVERATGIPAAAFIGHTNAELGMPAEQVARWDSWLEEVFATARPLRREFAFDGPRGTEWFQMQASPEADATGIVQFVSVVTRNVTERMRAETALGETHRRVEAMIDRTASRIVFLDAQWIILQANPAFARQLGMDVASTLRQDYRLVCPDSPVLWGIEATLQSGEPYTLFGIPETDPVTPGMTIFSDWSVVPVEDIGGVVITVTDVTRHRRAENELLTLKASMETTIRSQTEALRSVNERLTVEVAAHTESERRARLALLHLDAVFEAMPVGLVVSEPGGAISRINGSFCSLFGIAEHEWVGNNLVSLLDGVLIDSTLLSADQPVEVRWRRADGVELAGIIVSCVVRDADGDPCGMITVVVDITEKRMMQQRLVAVVEEERRRISSDLHDSIGQNLTAMGFLAASLRRQHESGDKPNQQLDELIRMIREITGTVRSLTGMLAPLVADGARFRDELERFTAGIHDLYGIACMVCWECDTPFEDGLVTNNIYYIIREAVNNAAKHSGASAIRVSVFRWGRVVRVSVSDDGIGFPDDFRPGNGLNIMQYRAETIGGTVRFGRSEWGGALLELNLRKDFIFDD